MKDLQKFYKLAIEQLDAIGIPYGNIDKVTINTRAKKRWGQCCTTLSSRYWENRIFSINISVELLKDNISDEALMNTIIHEILHTCENCMNHGKDWQYWANYVNDCYSCYNIKRTTSFEEKGINRDEVIKYNYLVKCNKCGYEWKKQKRSSVVTYPSHYHCRCGGTLAVYNLNKNIQLLKACDSAK